MKPVISLVVNHTPWRPERAANMRKMLNEILPLSGEIPYYLNQTDHRGKDWQGDAKLAWHLEQWRWACAQERCTHHAFCTDDLALAPGFWAILEAMVRAVPDRHLGLLSNHPKAPELARAGHRWYRTNAWLVGPFYVVPRALFLKFIAWYELEPTERLVGPTSWNDDNSQNEWVTKHGPGEVFHPLPTPIEHDPDGTLPSTVGHGDRYSRERLSWRFEREVVELGDGAFRWDSLPAWSDLEAMQRPGFWSGEQGRKGGILPSRADLGEYVTGAPMLAVGGD